jgi:histidinol-phosphate aminotransferase
MTDISRPKVRIRDDVKSMQAYTPTTSLDVFADRLGFDVANLIKLDANENPFGSSPRVREALANLSDMNVYPDPESNKLRDLLSDYTGVSRDQILCGAGADELIEIILQLFIEPNDAIVNCPPTFAMYGFDAPLYYGRVVDVYRTDDFSLDIQAIEQAVVKNDAKLLFLCSPNNPSGNIIEHDTLKQLLELPTTIVLDEAYIEFTDHDSVVSWVNEYPNLIVLRTMSKWAGLAGLRVGYGIFPMGLMSHLWKIKQPYNVNLAADVAAQESLKDADYLMGLVGQMVEQRKRMEDAFSELPFLSPYPTHSNFVLSKVKGMSASDLRDNLAQEGIIVRYYNKPRLHDHIRISAGTPQQVDKLLDVLAKLA